MKRVSFLIAFFSITLSAISQVEGSSAYLGMAIPNKSHAAGFILGYKYQYDLPVDGLGFVGTVDFQYCRPKKKVRAQIDEGYENWLEVNNYDEGDVKTKRRESATFVVPFNFGVNYSYSFGRISSWAETGIGFAPVAQLVSSGGQKCFILIPIFHFWSSDSSSEQGREALLSNFEI